MLLARNTPVALVVGAASFFGSHLVDKLLAKDLQVIGVDDLTYGKKDNLSEASENKNFHLIISAAEDLDLDLERLDYVFLIPPLGELEKLNYKKILDLFRELKSRLLLISSIELYDEEKATESLKWLKIIESDTAKVAKVDNLNVRILRLGAVFGPRMNFVPPAGGLDPVIRLIQQALTGDLQKDTSLEFSSRALFIDDACNLAVRCILSGATAQKIFDGVLPAPIKVSEIKQILLDPVWYENKDFLATQLPPWPTPNLAKTIKFLNWHPEAKLISNLRKTISFFKDNEIKVPKIEVKSQPEGRGELKMEDGEWKRGKAVELQGLKGDRQKDEEEKRTAGKGRVKKKIRIPTMFSGSAIAWWMGILLISYGLIWPAASLIWGVLTFRYQFSSAVKSLEKGEFEQSLIAIRQANAGAVAAKSIFYSLEPIRQAGLLKSQFELGERLANLATQSVDSAQNTILGIQSLYQSLKSITGELNESPKDYFDQAKIYLASADENLSKAQAEVKREDFRSNLPKMLYSRVDSLSERLSLYTTLVKKARVLSNLLPEVVALSGSKNYLVILQNNYELRPTGGLIESFAHITFEDGKLKKLAVNDTSTIDEQLNLHVEPPKEIKNDLNQKDYFLRDANWEPDFPTSARQIEWFYTKETGERVEGVVALDISAVGDLLSSIGSLDLPDYNEKIDSGNLLEKAVSKKSFLTALTSSLFNKLFFLPNQNWPRIVASLGRSLARKHLSIYLDNPPLFSYLISQNWASVMPRETGEAVADFLAPVEANLGGNKANYYLDRKFNLETVISKDGEVSHRLRISYTNRSPQDTFPAGKYKNRMRIYLPNGSKLTKVLWGESNIISDVTGFVDYGRAGFSFLLELAPKEQKTLVLDYQTSLKLNFVGDKASYRLDVVKQAGTDQDPFVWSVTYPINMRLVSNQAQKISPQEYSIQTDLSTDKTFKLEFSSN